MPQPHAALKKKTGSATAPRAASASSVFRETAFNQYARSRLSIGAEAVAGAAHRVDEAVVAGGLERLAQAPDVHVDRALLDEHVVAPHVIEELRAGVDALWVGHQEVQQA